MQRKLVLPAARRAFTIVVVCFAALTAGAARADAPRPPIVLVLDPCARVDAQEVRRLVPIEAGAPLGAGDPRDTTRVSVGCVAGAPQVVRLEVRDPTTGRTLDRDVTLEGVSKANQARLVAIASVELVAASQGDPGHVAEAGSIVATPLVAPPAPPRWRALASGALRVFSGMPRALVGGDLAVERQLPRRFDLVADVDLEGAAQPTALGDIDALVASVGLLGALRGARGRATWEAGVGARGGVAQLVGHGEPSALGVVQARTVSAPWLGPLVAARATLAFGRAGAILASLGAEAGYVTSAVVGQVSDHSDVGVRGVWWGATLGVGFAR
ncbi:MAG TPA: hypothetical protein VH560_02200 [Polyangia bacterium]|jgi:hypothetical protein|nr:hypothetical protein [Polyangia bacterium]